MSKILVIDDNDLFRQYVVTLLERAGYEVVALRDGSRVKSVLLSEQIDAIVSDLYMPNIDGLEVLALKRQYAPTAPVIGISGGSYKSADPCLKAMQVLGATAVLKKPIDGNVFLAILRDALIRHPRATA